MMSSILSDWLTGRVEPRNAKVLVQGITGRYGRLHAEMMKAYGTNIVAGTSPGKAGEFVAGIPVFNDCKAAVKAWGAEVSVVFVPAPHYLEAVTEAFEAGVNLVVGITERVPVRDTLHSIDLAKKYGGHIIGPNTPGIILPGKIKLGIMPVQPFLPGGAVVLSRSGTLTYEISNYLKKEGLGIFVALGVGGDPVNSTNFIECLDMVRKNPHVDSVALIGEIGGDAEERVADFVLETKFPKRVAAYIAGRSAPREKKMGHAGAIIMGEAGTVESKEKALNRAGIPVARMPWELPALLKSKK